MRPADPEPSDPPLHRARPSLRAPRPSARWVCLLLAVSAAGGVLFILLLRGYGAGPAIRPAERREVRRILFGTAFGNRLTRSDAAELRSLSRKISAPAPAVR